jgi:hypothetical protein
VRDASLDFDGALYDALDRETERTSDPPDEEDDEREEDERAADEASTRGWTDEDGTHHATPDEG